jgi:hypothetical protein
MIILKRVVVIADLHCGHRGGLTPPEWWMSAMNKWGRLQRELWGIYTSMIEPLKPIDRLIVNGDTIDGKGSRSGGTELITADRVEQAEIAAKCILYTEADRIGMIYGTPYHTGVSEDWEDVVADKVKAEKIESHGWYDVDGLIFDARHFVSSSSIPHGAYTPIARDRLHNLLWNEHEEQPKANVILRSHVHKFDFCGSDNWVAIITPSLQGNTKFGSRRCSNVVHFGIIYFDILPDGRMNWDYKIARPKSRKVEVLKW